MRLNKQSEAHATSGRKARHRRRHLRPIASIDLTVIRRRLMGDGKTVKAGGNPGNASGL